KRGEEWQARGGGAAPINSLPRVRGAERQVRGSRRSTHQLPPPHAGGGRGGGMRGEWLAAETPHRKRRSKRDAAEAPRHSRRSNSAPAKPPCRERPANVPRQQRPANPPQQERPAKPPLRRHRPPRLSPW